MPINNVSDHAGMQDNTFTTHLDKSASSLSRLKEGFSNSSRLALPACARLAPRDLFHLEPRDLPSAFLGLMDNNNSNTLRKPRAPFPSWRHEHIGARSLHEMTAGITSRATLTRAARSTRRRACAVCSQHTREHQPSEHQSASPRRTVADQTCRSSSRAGEHILTDVAISHPVCPSHLACQHTTSSHSTESQAA